MLNLLLINPGAIIDIVALIFILGFALFGFARGFAKSFVSLFGTIISLLLAILLCPAVARFIESKFSLVTTLSESLSGTLDKIFGETIMNTTLEQATEQSLSDAGVAGWIISLVILFKGEAAVPMDVTLNHVLCPTIAYYIVIIISVIVLFILFKIILFLLSGLVKRLYVIGVIKVVDRVLGLVLGIISGIVYLDAFIILLSIIPINFIQNLYAHVLSSTFTMFLHNIDLFGFILNSVSINDAIEFVKEIVSKNVVAPL